MNRHRLARWAYRLISGRELPEFTNVEVLDIDPDSREIWTQFGVTFERFKHLETKMYEILSSDKTGKTATILIEMSKHCFHQNELALMSFVFGNRNYVGFFREQTGVVG